jgi:phage portal protein BeeE
MTPDEARARIDLPPTPGGNVVYRQQQDFSLEALSKRDAKDDPFATGADAKPLALPAPTPEPEDDTERTIAAFKFKYAEALHAA